MSDTESFEQAMEIARHVMCEECELIDDYRSLCQAHDDCLDCERAMVARLKAAHNREIRDVAQQQYHRGFEDGRHYMDAEHRAIAMRLRGLRFDGGSHENLARIAYAIYPCATGWTCESAAGLRDKLIDLMGGVSDGTAEPMTTDEFIEYIEEDTRRLKGDATRVGDGDDTRCCAGRGACDADDCDCAGEQTEVSDEQNNTHRDGCDNNSQRSYVQGHSEEVEHGGAADDCGADSGCGGCGGDLHMAGLVGYDVLWNERHEAVCALRRWKPEKAINNDHCGEIQIRLLYQLLDLGGAMMMDGADAAKKVRDRLIHLLGGDQPSGIDVLRAMDECEAEGRITDELRVWADSDVWSCKWEEFKAIADRIDRRAKHDRESDRLRIEKLVEQRDAARSGQDVAEYHTLCDELRDQRDDLMRKWLREHAECDELRKKLEFARGGIDILQFERGELQEKLNECERTHVELPKDADGEVFRVDGGARVNDLVLTIRQMTLTKSGWKIRAYDEDYEVEREASFFDACAPKPDLIEETIEKLTLGEITQTEAIERIKSFHGTARGERPWMM